MAADTTQAGLFLLDDFTDLNGGSQLGTVWQGFTDGVMGGRSQMSAGIVPEVDPYLRMTGTVSLENNGGFIQVRLPLADRRGDFDAREFSGLELEVRGAGDDYFLHLRTSRNRLPWAHYAAPLPVSVDWQTVRVPFDSFSAEYSIGRGGPDLRRLTSVAVVAGNAEFQADISVRRIALYR